MIFFLILPQRTSLYPIDYAMLLLHPPNQAQLYIDRHTALCVQPFNVVTESSVYYRVSLGCDRWIEIFSSMQMRIRHL